jgi:hypothetical protein
MYVTRPFAASGNACTTTGPNRVVMTTTDSNVWGGDSGHTYTFTRQPNGTTDVDVVVVREGKNIKGRLLGLVLGIFGRRVLGRELERPPRPSKPGTTRRERRKSRRPLGRRLTGGLRAWSSPSRTWRPRAPIIALIGGVPRSTPPSTQLGQASISTALFRAARWRIA